MPCTLCTTTASGMLLTTTVRHDSVAKRTPPSEDPDEVLIQKSSLTVVRSPAGAALREALSRRLEDRDLVVRAVGAQLHDQPRDLSLLLYKILHARQ